MTPPGRHRSGGTVKALLQRIQFLKEKHRRPLWAVKPIVQSQGNDGFGADSSPPQGDRCRRAIRPLRRCHQPSAMSASRRLRPVGDYRLRTRAPLRRGSLFLLHLTPKASPQKPGPPFMGRKPPASFRNQSSDKALPQALGCVGYARASRRGSLGLCHLAAMRGPGALPERRPGAASGAKNVRRFMT
jgi:hypothetical protein